MILASATILKSLLISKDSWWPRYVPQLWLLPIVPMALAFRERSSRLPIRLTWALRTLLFLDAAIVATVQFNWEQA